MGTYALADDEVDSVVDELQPPPSQNPNPSGPQDEYESEKTPEGDVKKPPAPGKDGKPVKYSDEDGDHYWGTDGHLYPWPPPKKKQPKKDGFEKGPDGWSGQYKGFKFGGAKVKTSKKPKDEKEEKKGKGEKEKSKKTKKKAKTKKGKSEPKPDDKAALDIAEMELFLLNGDKADLESECATLEGQIMALGSRSLDAIAKGDKQWQAEIASEIEQLKKKLSKTKKELRKKKGQIKAVEAKIKKLKKKIAKKKLKKFPKKVKIKRPDKRVKVREAAGSGGACH